MIRKGFFRQPKSVLKNGAETRGKYRAAGLRLKRLDIFKYFRRPAGVAREDEGSFLLGVFLSGQITTDREISQAFFFAKYSDSEGTFSEVPLGG